MTLTTQFYTLVAMIGMGSFYGAALDTYNRFLKRSERKRWIVFIHDILFWVIEGLLIFYVLFLVNEGEFRFYLFLALLCGFAAYQALFKKIYQSSLELVIYIVVRFVELCVKMFRICILYPIKWLILTIFTVLLGIVKGLYFLLKWIGRLFFMMIRVVLKPFHWMFMKLWRIMPKIVTKTVDKFYSKSIGILAKCENNIKTLLTKWKKDKD